VIEALHRSRGRGFEVREGVDETSLMEEHPGVQMGGFQFALHPLERGDIDLEVGHMTVHRVD